MHRWQTAGRTNTHTDGRQREEQTCTDGRQREEQTHTHMLYIKYCAWPAYFRVVI